MAGPTTKLLNAVTTAPTASPTLFPQRVSEETGVLMVNFSGTSFSLDVQGLSGAGAPLFTIATITQADLDSNGSYAVIVALFPIMRVNLTAISAGTISAWLVE